MRNWREAQYMPQSIVDSLRVPAIQVNVIVNAVQRIADFNVPLFAIPGIGPPPIARCPPRPACRRDRPMDTVPCDPDRNALAQLNGGFEYRAENPQSHR